MTNLRERAAVLNMRLLQRDGYPIDKIEQALRDAYTQGWNEALKETQDALGCFQSVGLLGCKCCCENRERVRALAKEKI